MRFDSRDLTVKLWADTSEACCGCSDTQPRPKCDGCTATQPGCQGCTATPPRQSEVPDGTLALLRQQLQQTLAGEAR